MSTNNGGAAFPVPSGTLINQGISARDYFAAAFLQGMVANPVFMTSITKSAGDHGLSRAEAVAQCCYEQADAMLSERAK